MIVKCIVPSTMFPSIAECSEILRSLIIHVYSQYTINAVQTEICLMEYFWYLTILFCRFVVIT